MKTYPSSFLEAYVANTLWKLERPASLETLWNDLTQEDLDDERIPYWADLWHSSLILGEFLYTKRSLIQKQICLDIGCGLGLTSLIPASFDAHVYAMDYQIKALIYCRKNIHHNKKYLKNMPVPFATDWRSPAFVQHSFSYIWAADILYEQAFIPHIVRFINFALKKNGIFWLADYDRGFQKNALISFQLENLIVNRIPFPDTIIQNAKNNTVTLFEITKEIHNDRSST